MKLARVVGNVVSTIKHEAYNSRALLLVEPINPAGEAIAPATIAVDCMGTGIDELVLIGAAPGAAQVVFDIKLAPIKEMIMGIIDHVELNGDIVLKAPGMD